MLSRENVEIIEIGRTYYYYIPIPKKVVNSCPIPENINFEAIDYSFKKCVTPSYFKAAINYELNYRENIYKTIIREYSKDITWLDLMHLLFKRLNVNPEFCLARAKTIEQCLNLFEREIDNSGLENAKKEVIGAFSQKRENYFSINPFLKNHEIYFSHLVKRYREKYDMWINYRIGGVIDSPPSKVNCIKDEELQKKLNLFWINPDLSDYRNTLIVADCPRLEYSLNNVNLGEYYTDLAYYNYCRPFEDLPSAVMGKELAINYLNKLMD